MFFHAISRLPGLYAQTGPLDGPQQALFCAYKTCNFRFSGKVTLSRRTTPSHKKSFSGSSERDFFFHQSGSASSMHRVEWCGY